MRMLHAQAVSENISKYFRAGSAVRKRRGMETPTRRFRLDLLGRVYDESAPPIVFATRVIIISVIQLTHGSETEKRGSERNSMDPFSCSGSSPQSESNQSLPSLDLRFENHFSLFL